ncbi:hypothetical protein FF38_04784 [Lucilia cuprina]|uniref:Uncharacterized protein n=1 Tax=Lucilia cuprina TaxID=7375 RepID=A0A0L0BTU5_LUCCU|nr:hypothetical protein FF38_04784 [Lucilia cuprina]
MIKKRVFQKAVCGFPKKKQPFYNSTSFDLYPLTNVTLLHSEFFPVPLKLMWLFVLELPLPPPPKQEQHFGEAGRLCKLLLLLVLLELAVVLWRFKGTVLLLLDVVLLMLMLLQLFATTEAIAPAAILLVVVAFRLAGVCCCCCCCNLAELFRVPHVEEPSPIVELELKDKLLFGGGGVTTDMLCCCDTKAGKFRTEGGVG